LVSESRQQLRHSALIVVETVKDYVQIAVPARLATDENVNSPPTRDPEAQTLSLQEITYSDDLRLFEVETVASIHPIE
jgi:hypothetical protein